MVMCWWDLLLLWTQDCLNFISSGTCWIFSVWTHVVCLSGCSRRVVCSPTLPTFVSFQSYPHHLWTKGESVLLVNGLLHLTLFYVFLWHLFLIFFPQMVLWGIKIPPLTSTGGVKWHCHGSGILPGAYCCHAFLLGQCLCHLWHSWLCAAGLRRPGGLDHLLHCPRYLKHSVDV